jgi:hypothetical protein
MRLQELRTCVCNAADQPAYLSPAPSPVLNDTSVWEISERLLIRITMLLIPYYVLPINKTTAFRSRYVLAALPVLSHYHTAVLLNKGVSDGIHQVGRVYCCDQAV